MTRGAGFNLSAPPAVKFDFFDETSFPVKSTGVYELLNTAPANGPDPLDPTLLAGAIKAGNLLTVGVFQKDRRATAKDSGVALLQIKLELGTAATAHVGDVLALAITKSKYIPGDIGVFSGGITPDVAAKSQLMNMDIALGTLSAR
jgi:hypothetical protein